MAGRPTNKIPSMLGARLATLRKKAGFSQMQLAKVVGIPQRTLSFYEREGSDIPSSLAVALAKAFEVSVEEILGVNQAVTKKRGPKSQIERQLEIIAELPRSQQQRILAVVQALIAKDNNVNPKRTSNSSTATAR